MSCSTFVLVVLALRETTARVDRFGTRTARAGRVEGRFLGVNVLSFFFPLFESGNGGVSGSGRTCSVCSGSVCTALVDSSASCDIAGLSVDPRFVISALCLPLLFTCCHTLRFSANHFFMSSDFR